MWGGGGASINQTSVTIKSFQYGHGHQPSSVPNGQGQIEGVQS